MSYEEYLNQLPLDPALPLGPSNPAIKWFFEHEPLEEKQKIIALAGANTYAYVSTPFSSGFIRQPTRAEHGVNFNERIVITLYQRGTGNKYTIQEDSQIYKLWRQMIIDAAGINSIGRGVTELYYYRAVPSACKQPDVSPDGKGIFAEVVHQFKYRIGT
jgi:hypothetical protein